MPTTRQKAKTSATRSEPRRTSSRRPIKRKTLQNARRKQIQDRSQIRAGARKPRQLNISPKNANTNDLRFMQKYASLLSKTTLRAKWIHSSDEHEDRQGQSLATRSHDVIRHWAEERGAQPVTVSSSRYNGRPGVLRFNFPGFGGRNLQPISWDEWFRPFDLRKLVFVFQEHKKSGSLSNFFRLDNPMREAA